MILKLQSGPQFHVQECVERQDMKEGVRMKGGWGDGGVRGEECRCHAGAASFSPEDEIVAAVGQSDGAHSSAGMLSSHHVTSKTSHQTHLEIYFD